MTRPKRERTHGANAGLRDRVTTNEASPRPLDEEPSYVRRMRRLGRLVDAPARRRR
jgi:hypothetical protein